jgi:hypothetical protein
MLDVFHTDAFGVVPLTDAINKIPFVPGRIGGMGLFAETGIATTSVAIEERDGLLTLVAPTPRGGPGITLDKKRRVLRALSVPHFEINDAVMAEEVQGVRAWGSETEVEMLMGKVAERGALASQSLEATQEYARIGAIKGVVTYADSTTLSLFTEFGVSAESELDFDLDNATPASGALRKKCAGVYRQMAGILEGSPFSGIYAFCGDAFFDDLIAHSEVRATYLASAEASELRSMYISGGMSYGAFLFGGITWENYRGAVGSTTFVHTDKCHLFPVGVPGLFRTYYAPADYIETVNTQGRRLYAKQYDMPNGKGVHLDTQMNALNICTRPKVLIPGKRT